MRLSILCEAWKDTRYSDGIDLGAYERGRDVLDNEKVSNTDIADFIPSSHPVDVYNPPPKILLKNIVAPIYRNGEMSRKEIQDIVDFIHQENVEQYEYEQLLRVFEAAKKPLPSFIMQEEDYERICSIIKICFRTGQQFPFKLVKKVAAHPLFASLAAKYWIMNNLPIPPILIQSALEKINWTVELITSLIDNNQPVPYILLKKASEDKQWSTIVAKHMLNSGRTLRTEIPPIIMNSCDKEEIENEIKKNKKWMKGSRTL